jgi:phosphoribosylglycinamide formyltransferase-1
MPRKRVAVLISGRGSNMQALVEATRDPNYPADIALVLSNRQDAAGLNFAQSKRIPTQVIDHKYFSSRETFDHALSNELSRHNIDIVCCAGFMRILTPAMLELWKGRILNIHPSLLPAYKGLHTHQRALADGATLHGATVHFVTPELDGGPIVAQAAVPVLPGDTAATLAARVLQVEHPLYVKALALVATGEVQMKPSA